MVWLGAIFGDAGYGGIGFAWRHIRAFLVRGGGHWRCSSQYLPGYPPGAVVLLGMVAYFTGVVRALLTVVIIISETTASRGLMMPLLGAALMGDFAAQFVSKEKLYHGLATRFAVAT